MSANTPPASNPLLRALSERQGMPTGVHLQVADRCNHTCVHCYQVQGLKGELSLEQLKRLLDELAAAGVLMLSVSGGEATLRPDLVDILAYARERGFAIRLYTNAFAVTDALADALAAIGLLEVHVSVYSDAPAEHDAVTGVPGSLERTLAGIRRLRARGMRVVMKSPSLAAAAGATPRLRALAESLGCAFAPGAELLPSETGSLAPLATGLPPETLVELGTLSPWAPPAASSEAPAETLSHRSCGVCASGLVVLPNGDLLPCSNTIVTLGNLTQRPLREIYRTHPVVDLLRKLTWADVHGCRDCDLRPACHRCHATALQENGDYLGPQGSACARARARYAAGVGETLRVLEPDAGCEPGRNPSVGPYRIEAPGVLRPVADVVTEEDRRRVEAHPWLRSASASAADRADAGPGSALVPVERLRRATASPRGATLNFD